MKDLVFYSKVERTLFAVSMCLVLSTAWNAEAVPIYSSGGLNPGATIIDFEDQTVSTPLPLTIGNVTFSSSSTDASIRPQGWTQYPGIFDGRYVGFGSYSFFLGFATPVAEVAMGVFDPNYDGTALIAYDAANNELERIQPLPLGPPGGGFSTFVGFVRPGNDIARIELIPQAGDWLGIDNVTFYPGNSVVPEPSTYLLFGSGLIGLVWHRRRKGQSRENSGDTKLNCLD